MYDIFQSLVVIAPPFEPFASLTVPSYVQKTCDKHGTAV
jgi:hypothetical protein